MAGEQKPFIVAFVRDLERQVFQGYISYSRMVELLNERAIEWHEEKCKKLGKKSE